MKSLHQIGLHDNPLRRHIICKSHGEFESLCFVNNIWTSCPHCASDRKLKEEQQKQKEYLIESKKKAGSSLIPARYLESSFDNYSIYSEEQRQIAGYCIKYASRFDEVLKRGLSMIFIGKNGTGKTHLACAIANQIIKKNHTAVYITSYKAIQSVKSSWNRSAKETAEQAHQRLIDPSLLIIDDLGDSIDSEMEKRILFNVISERYLQLKPTIIIGNHPAISLDKTDLNRYLGVKIMSYLLQNGGKIHQFNWDNYQPNFL